MADLNPEETLEPTIVIAIDGPAASGKSTVARELAERIGFYFLSSGHLYRGMTWACVEQDIDCTDPSAVADSVSSASIDIVCKGIDCHPLINGHDPRLHLRDLDVTANVSPVSAVREARQVLSDAIRSFAHGRHTVIEGRDIGSAVFPDTPYKFYIDASPQVRQKRRRAQGQAEEISRRDEIDSTRAIDPLMIARGATVIDTSDLDVEGVVSAILERLCAQGLEAALQSCSNE